MHNNSEERGVRGEEILLTSTLRTRIKRNNWGQSKNMGECVDKWKIVRPYFYSDPNYSNYSAGFTLIELVITIVILSIGVTAFISVMNASTIASVDPMVRQQAHAVAQSYLEEVLLNSFCDPDLSTDCPTFCTSANICSTCGGSASPGAETRQTYDDVCDYNGLSNSGARNQFDAAIADLANYNVTVSVEDNGITLDGLNSANGQVVRVDVNVTHSSNTNVDVTLSGYRTNY